MKRVWACTLLWALVGTPSHAQSITADFLSKQCATKGAPEMQAACVLVIKAFMDGWIEGVGKGVLAVYTQDEQVLKVVGDTLAVEMAPRMKRISDRATCIGAVTVGALADAFVKRVQKEPALGGRNYREALTRTIDSEFCSK